MFTNDIYAVRLEGFEVELELLNDFTMRHGAPIMNGDRAKFRYSATVPNGARFDGDQFCPSPHAVKLGIWAIAVELIEWLCIRPGDTDGEFFADYTPDQLEWATSVECELCASMFHDAQMLRGDYDHLTLDAPMVEVGDQIWSAYTLSYVTTDEDWDDLVYLPMLIRRGHYADPTIGASGAKEEGYNGWANIETWNVALWAFNTQWRYDAIRSCASSNDPYRFDALRAAMFTRSVLFASGNTPDGHSLDNVDWEEIAAAFNEAIQ